MRSLKWGGAFAVWTQFKFRANETVRSLRCAPALMVALLSASALSAQEPGVAPAFGQCPVEIHGPGNDLDIPQPPGAIQNTPAPLPGHGVPPVPEGAPTGIPEPNSPPITVSNGGPGAPCDVRYFQNTIVNPGGNFSQIGEPAAAFNRDTSFFTWNWGAALSQNAGETWSYVNPYTRFPSIDGGFCCDQRTTFVPEHDMTVWYLQYVKSTTTQLGHCRIAISTSRTNLANNVWHSYTFAPDNFGFGTGEWLDFPDVSYSNDHLYCCSNIFRVSDNAYVDSVVWKMQLSQLDAAVGVNYWYWTRLSTAAIGGGGSYRLAQNSTSTQYLASHNSTSQIRAFRNPDSPSNSAMSWSNVNVASWSGGSYSAQAPNGVNWAGRADSRILGGYAKSGEYGFMWHVGRRPANGRAQCYVRVSQLSTATNALIGEQDIWNATLAFLYPAVAVNASGEPGYTTAFGQGDGAAGWNPTNFYRVVDPAGCGVNFGGGSISVPFSGQAPTSASWGDYFTVQRSNNQTNTFIATGMARGTSAQQSRYIWFGKEEDTPITPIVTVDDNIPVAVPITVTHTDLDGLKNGSTTFTRRYVFTGRYELIAPSSVTSGANTYLFCYWGLDINGGTAFVNQPAGQTRLTVDSIGGANDRARTFYSLQTRITVNDLNVAGSVPITVGTTDLDGNKNGNTTFVRRYKTVDGPFSFTAPAIAGASQPFYRWFINGAAQPIGQTTISVSPGAATMTLDADYCVHTTGTFTRYGSGCNGSNGSPPAHTATAPGGTPERGEVVTYQASNAVPNQAAALFFGFSRTLWNGVPLPLSLGFIGADPSCAILAEGFVVLPFTTNGAGVGTKNIQTSSASAIGTRIYTQTVHIDFGVPSPLKITVSNGLETVLGGDDCR